LEFDKFIRNAEFFVVGVVEGEDAFVCLFSTVLTVTVVPAGIFLVRVSVLLVPSCALVVLGKLEHLLTL